MRLHVRHLFNRFFRDEHGEIVMAQAPNLPILGWAICAALSKLIREGRLHTSFHLLAQAFLFTWAYMEIRSGVTPFRRTLGALVMLGLLLSFLIV
jgi:hypothetical protein